VTGLLIAALVTTAGCVDLADPTIPSLGAGAILNITVRQITGQPIDVSGTLAAGRDSAGVPRKLLSPLIVLGTPVDVGEPNAQRIYIIAKQIADSANFIGPFEIQPPVIEAAAVPPVFRWYGLKRLDPDTVVTDLLGDVTLHVQTEFGAAVTPVTRTRQWFLELRGDANVIHVSGDGAPPEVLRIPSQFIPSAPSGRVFASLIYFQSATVVPQPPTYISAATLDVRTQWIIRLR
jgi:hypothetical protein